MTSDDDDKTTFDPTRSLCPDDACIGVLAPDGKCPVCGAAGQPGRASAAGSDAPADDDGLDHAEAEASTAELTSPPSGFDPARRLCSDDACIGVIGPDGHCTECGARG